MSLLDYGNETLLKTNYPLLYLLVYTTEPWTLTAANAVSVHPQMNYIVFQHEKSEDGAYYIISHPRCEIYKEKLKRNRFRKVSTSLGEGLHALKVVDPLFGKTLRVCIDKNIKSTYGSGINIVCPAHFVEDFKIAQVIIFRNFHFDY